VRLEKLLQSHGQTTRGRSPSHEGLIAEGAELIEEKPNRKCSTSASSLQIFQAFVVAQGSAMVRRNRNRRFS